MDPDFFAIAFSFPTIAYTVALFASLVYWVLGGLGLGHDDAVSGKVDGALHADGLDAVDALHAADGLKHGLTDIDDVGDLTEGAIREGATVGHGLSPLSSLLRRLGLRNAPISITFSILSLVAWLTSYLGAVHVLPLVGDTLASRIALFAAAIVPAIFITGIVTKPIGKLFSSNPARGRQQVVGSIGRVRSSVASGERTQIRVRVGADELLLDARAEDLLSANEEVVVLDYDASDKLYRVAPLERK